MSPQQPSQREAQDDDFLEPECGHVDNVRKYGDASIPGLGTLCRPCYGESIMGEWPDPLRKKDIHHPTGETSHPKTILIGVDKRARLLYLDEFARQLLRVIPKHDPNFKGETPLTDQIMRGYQPKHGESRPDPVHSPSGDVIAVVEREPVNANYWDHRALNEWILEQGKDEFAAFSDFAIDNLWRSTVEGTSEFVKEFTEDP